MAFPLTRVNLVWFSNLGNSALTFSYNLIILTQSFTYSLNSIWFGLSNKPMPSPHIATVTFSESNMVIFSLTFPITQFCLYLNREKNLLLCSLVWETQYYCCCLWKCFHLPFRTLGPDPLSNQVPRDLFWLLVLPSNSFSRRRNLNLACHNFPHYIYCC